MKHIAIIMAALCAACFAQASDQVWELTSHPTNSTYAVTNSAKPFVGKLQEIAIYAPAGSTGSVSIAIVDPFATAASFVIVTNAITSGYTVWHPRIMPVALAGATALTVTNVDGVAGCYFVAGETVTATLSEATATNKVWKFRLKYEK